MTLTFTSVTGLGLCGLQVSPCWLWATACQPYTSSKHGPKGRCRRHGNFSRCGAGLRSPRAHPHLQNNLYGQWLHMNLRMITWRWPLCYCYHSTVYSELAKLWRSPQMIWSLGNAIVLTNPVVLDTLAAVCSVKNQFHLEMHPIRSSSPAAFRNRFRKLCTIYGLQHHSFRPYSLRRGGATYFFQKRRSMDEALLRGRWESSRVAKTYIMDALSYLPSIRRTPLTTKMLQQFHFWMQRLARRFAWVRE